MHYTLLHCTTRVQFTSTLVARFISLFFLATIRDLTTLQYFLLFFFHTTHHAISLDCLLGAQQEHSGGSSQVPPAASSSFSVVCARDSVTNLSAKWIFPQIFIFVVAVAHAFDRVGSETNCYGPFNLFVCFV